NEADIAAISAVPAAWCPARNRQGFPLRVLEHIGCVGRVVPEAELVRACQFAIAESRLPSDLEGNERSGRPGRIAGIKSVCSSEVTGIHLISSDLGIAESRNCNFQSAAPLAHRPIEPIVPDQVARLRTAECQIHKIAGKGCRVLADRESTDLPVQEILEVGLLIPQLSDAPCLSPAKYFLNFLE